MLGRILQAARQGGSNQPVQQHTAQPSDALSRPTPAAAPPPHAPRPRTHEALQVLLGAAHHLACGSQRAGGGSGAAGRPPQRRAMPGQAHSSPGGAAITMSPRCRVCRGPGPPQQAAPQRPSRPTPEAAMRRRRPPLHAATAALAAGRPGLPPARSSRRCQPRLTCCVRNTPGSLCTMLACRKRTGTGSGRGHGAPRPGRAVGVLSQALSAMRPLYRPQIASTACPTCSIDHTWHLQAPRPGLARWPGPSCSPPPRRAPGRAPAGPAASVGCFWIHHARRPA